MPQPIYRVTLTKRCGCEFEISASSPEEAKENAIDNALRGYCDWSKPDYEIENVTLIEDPQRY